MRVKLTQQMFARPWQRLESVPRLWPFVPTAFGSLAHPRDFSFPLCVLSLLIPSRIWATVRFVANSSRSRGEEGMKFRWNREDARARVSFWQTLFFRTNRGRRIGLKANAFEQKGTLPIASRCSQRFCEKLEEQKHLVYRSIYCSITLVLESSCSTNFCHPLFVVSITPVSKNDCLWLE